MDDPLRVAFAILFPFLVGVVIVVGWFAWRGSEPERLDLAAATPRLLGAPGHWSDVRLVSTWLAVSAFSEMVAWGVLFGVTHVLLFTFGTGIAWVAMIGSGILLAAIPAAWAVVIRRLSRERAR